MSFDLSKLEPKHAEEFVAAALKGLALIRKYTSSATAEHAADILTVIGLVIDQIGEAYRGGPVTHQHVMDEFDKLEKGLDDHFDAAKAALAKKFHHVPDPDHKE